MTDETKTCACSATMKSVGVHETVCPLFVNMIPNEIVKVYVPAPAELGARVIVAEDDKALLQMLDAAVNLAAQARERALRNLALRSGLPTNDPSQRWIYDFAHGTWTRTN